MFPDFQFKIAYTDHVSSNKCPWPLFSVEALKGSAYKRVALKRVRYLLEKKRYSYKI